MLGASEHTKSPLSGDEPTYTIQQVLEMVWDLRRHASRIQGNEDKGGMPLFLFLNGSGEVNHIHANIVQSIYLVVCQQIKERIKRVDDDLGSDAGFLMVIDNVKQHHKAFRKMTKDWDYYPPVSAEKSAILEFGIIPLGPTSNNGAAQYYRLRKSTDALAENARFVLMITPGMTAFRPCEFQFLHLKERIARLPETESVHTTSINGQKITL